MGRMMHFGTYRMRTVDWAVSIVDCPISE